MRRILLFIVLIATTLFSFSQGDKLPQVNQSQGTVSEPTHIRLRCGRTLVTNQPLWVVDGIISDSFSINKLNPNAILRIDILKAPAAGAIYGSDAMNGAIIITTKRSKHLIIQDLDSKKDLEGATVKIRIDQSKDQLLFISDSTGEVDLSNLQGKKFELEISCIGYKTTVITLTKEQLNKNIQLEKEYRQMNEVVVYSSITCHCTRVLTSCCFSKSISSLDKDEDKKQRPPVSYKIYPNPVQTFGTITIQSERSGRVDIVNSAGQLVQSATINSKNSNSTSIKLNIATPGIYFIRFTDSEKKDAFTQKLIVQ